MSRFKSYRALSNILSINIIGVITFYYLSGCSKQEIIEPKNIIGQWEWISTYSVTPYSETNPLTQQNTGNEELLVFDSNHNWYNSVNGIITDSGTFLLGHGVFAPYQGARIFEYDSIAYFKNCVKLKYGDYYKIKNDSLQFCPGFAGRFNSYSLPTNGSKFWIRVH